MDEKHNKPKYFPADIIQQAEVVLKAWNKYKDLVPFTAMTPADFKSQLSKIKELEDKANDLQKKLDELREVIPGEKRELFEVLQKLRNSARAAFGLRDTRLAEFGLNPTARRGRPPKSRMGKQLGLELPKETMRVKMGNQSAQEQGSKEKPQASESQKTPDDQKVMQEESPKSQKEQTPPPVKDEPQQ